MEQTVDHTATVQTGSAHQGGQARRSETILGLIAVTADAGGSLARRATRRAMPIARGALHPPLVPESLHPSRVVEALAERGQNALSSVRCDVRRAITAWVPAVVNEVLDQLNLNAIIAERLDLDALVATVDMDQLVNRIDVDDFVQRVDIDALLDRIEIEAVVRRLDVDNLADRIDVARVLARVDVDAMLAGVNLDAVVERLDVLGIAQDVINEIDLPEIIRDSTGSMASQVVRDARLQSIDADEAVSRFVDRLLRRRRSAIVTPPAGT